MAHIYDDLSSHLKSALQELQRLGMGPSLSKGRVGEILLAHLLGHTLHINQRGADGIDPNGRKYEYKVSHDNQFNFNFGHARGSSSIQDLVTGHFEGIEGAYCALMDGPDFIRVVYCPSVTLVPHLKNHLLKVKGSTFQKVFSPIERFAQLPSATIVYPNVMTT
ncbi:MAG: hypothetical protein ING33_05015 [Rhodocyclaceae bacterium]|nr:hypothetical protein [Rhodocyclaceae bacterium]